MYRILTAKPFIYFLLLLACFNVASDPDLWWHLKYGDYIYSTLSIPIKDTYSFTMMGYPWADSYILSQVLMFLLHSVGGYVFLSFILTLILISFLYLAVNKIYPNNGASLTILILLGLTLSSVGVKPLIFSSIFMFLFWYIILFFSKINVIFSVPLIFLIWSFAHADFLIGISILAFYTTVRILLGTKERKNFLRSLLIFFIFLLSVFATFLNPNGVELYTTLFKEVFSMSLQGKYIQEWRPPFYVYGIEYLVLFASEVVFSGFILYSLFKRSDYKFKENKVYPLLKRKRVFLFTVLSLTLILSLKSAYFFRLFVIFSSPLLYVFFYEVYSLLPNLRISKKIHNLIRFLSIVLILIVVLNFIVSVLISRNIQAISHRYAYPYDAVNYIKSNDLEGNMLNSYEWGGYLIYHLPEHKTFIDGRMPAWKEEDVYIFKDYIALNQQSDTEKEEFKDIIQRYSIDWALVSQNSGVAKNLQKHLGWKVKYSDEVALILVP